MYCKWLEQLPSDTKKQVRELIEQYSHEHGGLYDTADIDDIMCQKTVDIMYLDDNDIYLSSLDNILKDFIK